MSFTTSYPGVYIQELPSPVHTIAGVATSIAAFVGYTPRGIDGRAQVCFSFSDFERLYGGLASNSELSYGVQQFFQNGGTQAYIVRVGMHDATFASVSINDELTFTALSSGSWSNSQLLVDIDTENVDLGADALGFNLTITDLADQTAERFPNLTMNPAAMNYISTVVNDPDNGSQLVNVSFDATSPPNLAVPQSGIIGAPITQADVNTALGGDATATTTTEDFGLVMTTSSPEPTSASPLFAPGLAVTVFPSGASIPQSMAGLALQLQQSINSVLGRQLPGASVQCSVTQSDGGQAIRVNALLPQQPDAIVEFGPPAEGGHAAEALGVASLALNSPPLSSPPHGSESFATSSNVAHYALGTTHVWGFQSASVAGEDAAPNTTATLPTTEDLIGDEQKFSGLYALEKVDLFNLLSIPDATRALASDPNALDPNVNPVAIYSAAITLCDKRRAFLLVDPPPYITTPSGAVDWKSNILGITDPNGAAFWPRLRLPDPLNNFNLRSFAPSGVVAGVYATIDANRGVWKAPAGIEATLNGVQSMTYQLSDDENGLLNPLGLNCFRTFPVYGRVVWGARTLAGADAIASQWKYVPVRRMALFLEESLYRGSKWVVFEPNDEPLWAAIRLNVGSFMQTYFLKGAFQGKTPDQAYFVKCDSETTTPTDIDNGIVNILVGFAPLEPAEFVVIQIEQLTGQAQS